MCVCVRVCMFVFVCVLTRSLNVLIKVGNFKQCNNLREINLLDMLGKVLVESFKIG